MNKQDLMTPALLVDLDRMERNLDKMATFFSTGQVKLRPHFKNHKCVALAQRQMAAGAIGMTCATLAEAEIVAEAGIHSILIANELASDDKLRRFASLSKKADVIVAVDNADVARRLGSIAKESHVSASVLLDLNIGLDRCGVAPGLPAVELAKVVLSSGLRLRGLMGYEGHILRRQPGPDKLAAAQAAMKMLTGTKTMIEEIGAAVEIVSGGGTGSYELSGAYPGVTEIQAGSYLLMETDYATVRPEFEVALSVLTTVISKTDEKWLVVDTGLKSMSCERGLPRVRATGGLATDRMNAEHGILKIEPGFQAPEVGSKLEIWVHYADGTINLYDRMYGVRHGRVEEVFEISRRRES